MKFELKTLLLLLLTTILFSCKQNEYELVSTTTSGNFKVETIIQNDTTFVIQKDPITNEIYTKEFVKVESGCDAGLIVDVVMGILTFLALAVAFKGNLDGTEKHREDTINNKRPEVLIESDILEIYFSNTLKEVNDETIESGLLDLFYDGDISKFEDLTDVHHSIMVIPVTFKNVGIGTAIKVQAYLDNYSYYFKDNLTPNKVDKFKSIVMNKNIVVASNDKKIVFLQGELINKFQNIEDGNFKLVANVTVLYEDIMGNKYHTKQKLTFYYFGKEVDRIFTVRLWTEVIELSTPI